VPFFYKIILAFQVLLDLHLVLLTFFLGRALTSHGAGLLAALFQGLSPLAAAASCRILTDSIFAFMLIAAVVLLIRHFRTGGWWSLVSAALIMGSSCYVRPVGLAFSAVMVLVVVCSRRGTLLRSTGVSPASSTGILPVSSMGVSPMSRTGILPVQGKKQEEQEEERRKTKGETPLGLTGKMPVLRQNRPHRLLRLATFAGIVLTCIAPWVVRNITVADYWGFSSFATDSLYWYSAAEIEARQQHTSFEVARLQFEYAEIEEQQKTATGAASALNTPGGLARWRFAKARRIIAEHPLDFLDIHLRGDVAFWLPGAPDALEVLGYTSGNKGTLDVLHRQGLVAAAKHYFGDNTPAMIIAAVMVAVLLIQYGGVILCGLWRLRLCMTAAGWLCLLLVLTAWLLPGAANGPRFRVPVEPILSAAAAIGWVGLVQWRRGRKLRRAQGTCGGDGATAQGACGGDSMD